MDSKKDARPAMPQQVDAEARRDFLKKVGKASAAAPAAALLLAAADKAEANAAPSGGSGSS